MHQIDQYKDFSKQLAEVSGKLISHYFRTEIKIDSKLDESPITIADKKAEEVMRELIHKEFPEHGIIGEEFGNFQEDAEYVWVLDPIDGTKSFISGALSFGTLISLMKNNQPILGVINHPILNELLIGDNETASLNDKIVNIRDCENLSDSTLLTTDHFNIGKYQNQTKFDELVKHVNMYRNWGDCYGYYLLATGFADIMIDPIMSKWDTLALIPIIKGAGGIISDYQGNDPVEGDSIVACGKQLHSKVIELLN